MSVPAGWFSSSAASQLSVAVHVYYSAALVASGAAANATLLATPLATLLPGVRACRDLEVERAATQLRERGVEAAREREQNDQKPEHRQPHHEAEANARRRLARQARGRAPACRQAAGDPGRRRRFPRRCGALRHHSLSYANVRARSARGRLDMVTACAGMLRGAIFADA